MDLISQYAWDVSEEEYRKSDALHYSLISQYINRGIDALINPVRLETEALFVGSMVDCWITEGIAEFERKYKIIDFPVDPDVKKIIDITISQTNGEYKYLQNVPIPILSDIAKANGFWPADKWPADKRVEAFYKKQNAAEYYLKAIESYGNDINIVPKDMYQVAYNCVRALVDNLYCFQRLYGIGPSFVFKQIKFKAEIEGVEYAAMFDVLQQDPVNKILYPIDLKTSSKSEYNFVKSFLEFNYHIQARLYTQILKEVIKGTPFEEYTIAPFEFIVVSKTNLNPLGWSFEDSDKRGTLEYNGIKLPDPLAIGQEIKWIIDNQSTLPKGLTNIDTNSITKQLLDDNFQL